MAPEGKIKSKNLSYESTLPPFLQRLHDQNAGRGDQDRHERQIARPKRAKTHDEDDEPTVVDESGELVSKESLEKMSSATNGDVEDGGNVKGSTDVDAEPKASGAIQDDQLERSDQKVTDGTATKKRKAGKVVGEDSIGNGDDTNEKNDSVTTKAAKKIKKKAKPIKLAFHNDDD